MRGNTITEIILCIALVSMTLLCKYFSIEARDLRNQMKGMQETCQPISVAQLAKPVKLEDTGCAAWLFNTDLVHAKKRICGTR